MPAWAVEDANVPVIADNPALERYLKDVQQSLRNYIVTTTSPNGNRRGLRGDVIFYNDGAGLRFCRNNSTDVGGGTSWSCENASSATSLCFEGTTENDFETCFSITDPTADRTITIPNASVDLTATAPGLTLSTTNAAGSASTVIRTDATMAAFDATVPVTQAFGDAAATGSAAIAARRDHKHGMPTNSWMISYNPPTPVSFTFPSGGGTFDDVPLAEGSAGAPLTTIKVYRPSGANTCDIYLLVDRWLGGNSIRIVVDTVTSSAVDLGGVGGGTGAWGAGPTGVDVSSAATGWIDVQLEAERSTGATTTIFYAYMIVFR